MKILLVSSFFPYPLFSGGQVRLYNLLRNLGKRHQVTLLCETRGEIEKEDLEAVKKYCYKIKTVIRPKQWSFKNILRTGFSLYPFLLVGHQNEEMKHSIGEELKKENYSLLHMETFYVMHNLPDKVTIPVVLAEHNIEYKIYKHWVEEFWFWPLKPFLYLDVLKMFFWEKFFWQKANKLVAVSDEDKKVIEGKTSRKVELISNGVDCDYFSEIKKTEPEIPSILFVGSFKWMQNRDAAKYLLKDLWPKIKERMEKVKLWIVGNYSHQFLRNINDPKVVIEDSVEDIRRVYTKATILLAPIRLGGGTKFKILESMACGLPVITTAKGIEGLGADTNGIVVGNTEEELIENVIGLLKEEKKRKEISVKEKEFVKKHFDWKDISEKLEKVYENCY